MARWKLAYHANCWGSLGGDAVGVTSISRLGYRTFGDMDRAARDIAEAGYDGIELHGAHGYLLAQFLSQSTNLRTDKYGGSLENRSRLIVEVAQEIRRRTSPNFILGIKMNSVEFQDKGFQPEEAKQLASILEENKFDFIELSGGTYEALGFGHKRESTKAREGFFGKFSDR